MKKILILTAAFVAAVVILAASALPPARLTLPSPGSDGTVAGVIHIHTRRSDGRGTPEDVAMAAARQGLKFVVLTDHGDATRPPDAPVYRAGVLCIDAVEISTTEGHYLALGLPAAPYPLNGEARDVVEDVRRLGGWGVVAHPESPKEGLSWRAWDTPFDAIEWVNPDTSWRVRLHQAGWRRPWDVLEALIAYPVRPAETMARMISGTAFSAASWDRLATRRRVVIVAGADAHARLGFGSSEPADSGLSLPIPSYDASFGTLSVHVRPAQPFSGDAAHDAGVLLDGLRHGSVYVVIDALASPSAFQFTGTNGRDVVSAGGELSGGEATLTVVSNAPAGWTINLWTGSRIGASARSPMPLTYHADRAGVYRAEILAPSRDGMTPWIISNPIYLGTWYEPPPPVPHDDPVAVRELFDGRSTSGWRTEHDQTSVASLDLAATATSTALQFGYHLSAGSTSGQFAALAAPSPPGGTFTRVRFSVRGERPGRLEVQARGPVPPAARWQRSVYFDQTERDYSIDFGEMTPIGSGPASRLSPADVRDILFVIDTTHTAPGASGRVWITAPVLEK